MEVDGLFHLVPTGDDELLFAAITSLGIDDGQDVIAPGRWIVIVAPGAND